MSPAPVSRVALSNRDLLILVGLARGLTRKEIAHERGICLQHLKNQLTRIYAFLGSASAAQAVYLARHQIEEFVA